MSLASLNFLFRADTENFQRKLRESKKGVTSLGSTISKLGPMVAGAFSVGAIISFGKKIVEMAGEADKAYAKVEQAVKQTGGVAGFTAESLAKIAKQLQNITTYDDEEILDKVTAQLLSFPTIVGDNFTRAQKAVLDLATLLGGDLQSSAIQVGKALGDPVKGLQALRKSGVLFTEDQQDLIKSLAKSNKLFEAQSIILDVIESQYGGQAEALAKIPIGKIEQMKNAWGELGEELGNSVAPAVISVSESLTGLAKFLNRPYNERGWLGRFISDLDPAYHFSVLKDWISGTGQFSKAVNSIDASKPKKSLAELNKELAELEMNQWAAANATTEEQKALWGTAESYNSQIESVKNLIEESKKLIPPVVLTEEELEKLREKQEKEADAAQKAAEELHKEALEAERLANAIQNIPSMLEKEEAISQQADLMKGRLSTLFPEKEKELAPSSLGEVIDKEIDLKPVDDYITKTGMAIELTDTLADSIRGLGEQLAYGAESWSEYGEMVIKSLKQTIAMIIKEGVAIAVKNALIAYGASGPVALALAGLTGGLAAGIFSTALNTIPSFAEGGFIKNPQLVVAGDAKDGKGEWILNSSQMKALTAKTGSWVIKGELKARGRELVYVLNQETGFHNRT